MNQNIIENRKNAIALLLSLEAGKHSLQISREERELLRAVAYDYCRAWQRKHGRKAQPIRVLRHQQSAVVLVEPHEAVEYRPHDRANVLPTLTVGQLVTPEMASEAAVRRAAAVQGLSVTRTKGGLLIKAKVRFVEWAELLKGYTAPIPVPLEQVSGARMAACRWNLKQGEKFSVRKIDGRFWIIKRA